MKKLYRKGTVHPSPPPPLITDQQFSFLPHAILTLTVALSPEDREVLAYLISCSSSSSSSNNFSATNHPRRTPYTNKATTFVVDGDHPPLFNCTCFRCYMSYWVRWNSSPNHQLIHEIIDAFEDWLAQNNNKANKNKGNGRKEKRNKRGSSGKKSCADELICSAARKDYSPESEAVAESSHSGGEDGDGGDVVEEEEKGAVRRFVGFIGERIWGAWGQLK